MRLKRLMIKAVMAKKKSRKVLHVRHVGVGWKLSNSAISSSHELGWEEKRKKRKDALSEEAVRSVTDFYSREDVSHNIPNARGDMVGNDGVVGRKVLASTLSATYKQYKEMHPNSKVGFSTFKKIRPKHIVPYTQHKFRECLCEYCVNVDLGLKTLNTFGSSKGQAHITISDRYCASHLTLCPKINNQYKKKCLDRNCPQCGVHLLKLHLVPLLDEYSAELIQWYRWERAAVLTGTMTRMMKVQKEGSFMKFVEYIQGQLEPFSCHLFNAKWQYQQYKLITSDIPNNSVIFCMDYAKNYTCKAQDAPQGYHWTNVQCTINSIVATYNCLECPSSTVTDSIVFISNDLTHDQHAVHLFVGRAIEMLVKDGVPVAKVIQFSDGCASQYK